MNPEIRWPYFWDVLNILAFNFEEHKTERYKMFFWVLPMVLPCDECSQHCLEYAHQNRPIFKSKDDVISWVLDLHNKVNERNGKEQRSLEKYKNYCKERYKFDFDV